MSRQTDGDRTGLATDRLTPAPAFGGAIRRRTVAPGQAGRCQARDHLRSNPSATKTVIRRHFLAVPSAATSTPLLLRAPSDSKQKPRTTPATSSTHLRFRGCRSIAWVQLQIPRRSFLGKSVGLSLPRADWATARAGGLSPSQGAPPRCAGRQHPARESTAHAAVASSTEQVRSSAPPHPR